MAAEGFEFFPIGVVHSGQKFRYETPRQGAFSRCDGEIELFSTFGGDAVSDLAGFDRIWVVFCFHLNCGRDWKAKVRPPFPAGGQCRSVFATRSPHRPNPIGLSCVELAGISGNRLLVRHIDMLSGTPVLDIKPYIPEADAFPDSAVGWRAAVPEAEKLSWHLEYAPEFLAQAEFIRQDSGLDILNFVQVQLANEPFDSSRKRVKKLDDLHGMLGCRTWRINFSYQEDIRFIKLEKVESNYRPEELLAGAEDKYMDKELHRKFIREYNS